MTKKVVIYAYFCAFGCCVGADGTDGDRQAARRHEHTLVARKIHPQLRARIGVI